MTIIAKTACDATGNMLMDVGEGYETDDAKFFVRIKGPDGARTEMKCSYETYVTIGEGQTGDLAVQGNWIGSFTPYRKN